MVIAFVSACLAVTVPVHAQEADLPKTAPIPESRDENQPLPDVGNAVPVPVPESRDDNQPLPGKGDPVPVPDPRPAPPPDTAPEGEVEPPPDPGGQTKPEKPTAGDEQSDVMPKDEQACRAELEKLGAEFTEEEPIKDGFCEVAHPITLSALTDRVQIEPPVLLNCRTALTAARFAQEKVAPATREMLGSPLVGIRQASGYVCRVRAGTETVSEHAFANALDIASFTLADGREIAVRQYGRPGKEMADFLAKVRADACGPFTTVLGPGTNADHATHFHLDLEERHNTATYCH